MNGGRKEDGRYGRGEFRQPRRDMADRHRGPSRCRPPKGFLLVTKARGAAFPLQGVRLTQPEEHRRSSVIPEGRYKGRNEGR
jgi:hypothetical protein